MPRGTFKAFVVAVSVLAADSFSAVQRSGETWAAVVTAQTGERIEFKLGGEYPNRVKLKVELVDPDGNRTELPSSELDINGSGGYQGPEIPAGFVGFRVDLQIIDMQTGASLASSGSVVT